MGLRDTISKGVGKASDFLNEQQRKSNIRNSLENEKNRLAALYSELGKIAFHGKPYIEGRTHEIVVAEIKECHNNIESLQLQLSTPAEI